MVWGMQGVPRWVQGVLGFIQKGLEMSKWGLEGVQGVSRIVLGIP